MFEGLYFEYPKMASIIVVYIACEAYCKLRSSAIYFPHASIFTKETASVSTLLWFLKWSSTILLTLALMSPVRDASIALAPSEGYDIALVLDTSTSMQTKAFDSVDQEKSRFDIVKESAIDFIDTRVDDSIGLVLFSDDAFIAAPLSYDKKGLKQIVAAQKVDITGSLTTLLEAVVQAVYLMQRSKTERKVAILLSSEHNSIERQSLLKRAIDLAKQEKVRFYTVGVGSEYDMVSLETLAKESGGKSFSATSAKALHKIYREINVLEKSKVDHFAYDFKVYYYIYPLFLAFFLLLTYVYLRNKRGWL